MDGKVILEKISSLSSKITKSGRAEHRDKNDRRQEERTEDKNVLKQKVLENLYVKAQVDDFDPSKLYTAIHSK